MGMFAGGDSYLRESEEEIFAVFVLARLSKISRLGQHQQVDDAHNNSNNNAL